MGYRKLWLLTLLLLHSDARFGWSEFRSCAASFPSTCSVRVVESILSYLAQFSTNFHRSTRPYQAPNHATGAVNNRPPALSNVHFRGSTALIIMVMTAYNVTYIGWNYHCLCHLISICQSTKTLNHIVSIALIANTAVNPVLYSFLKKDIQREFSRLFSGRVLNPTEIVGKGHESPRPTTITGR